MRPTFEVRAELFDAGKDVIAWINRVRYNHIPNASEQLTFQLAKDIRDSARRNVKSRVRWGSTGQLEGSIVAVRSSTSMFKKGYSVTALTNYATAVEVGTKPHDIPNNPLWGMKGIKHPGSRPMWFMRDAIDEELTVVSKRIDEAFNLARWK